MVKRPKREIFERGLTMVCLLGIGILYGAVAYPRQWFPAPLIKRGVAAVETLLDESRRAWYFDLADREPSVIDANPVRLADGLIMVVGMTDGPKHFIRIIDRAGNVIQQWQPDWFEIWGDEGNYPPDRRPHKQPGSVLHGAAIADNGDVIFNFENLSTVRLSICGETRWKLENYGHHSIFPDADGSIWVLAETAIDANPVRHQNHIAPTEDHTIDRISADGRILESTSVIDILWQNDLLGLLYLSALKDPKTTVSGDTLHLNDVDVYPADFTSSIFSPGDIMVSLRNISTIFVMDPETHRIKYRRTGDFLRQHDPDFIGGDRILVLDNRNLAPSTSPEPPGSRILEIDAATDTLQIKFQGTGNAAFSTAFMGKQQLLDNGNLMVTSSMEGRAIELAPDGTLLWEYINSLDEGHIGLLTQAEILPQFMDKQFFANLAASCAVKSAG